MRPWPRPAEALDRSPLGGGRRARPRPSPPPRTSLAWRGEARSSTRRGPSGSAAEIRAGLARAPRRGPEARPHLVGPAPGRAEDRRRRTDPCAATALRASSGRRLLALLFAEREALLAAHRVAPLLLLDDVMSELDPQRRERLVERLARGRPGADHRRRRGVGAAARAASAVVRMPFDVVRVGRGMSRRRVPRPASEAFRAALRAGRSEDAPRGGAVGLGGGRRRAAGGRGATGFRTAGRR